MKKMDVMEGVDDEPNVEGPRRRFDSTNSNKYGLDDYIYEMQVRAMKNGDDPGLDSDVYALLAQKEKDLILAAELGKALLEKNEELGRNNERLAEDYSRKLEVSIIIHSSKKT